MTGLGQEVVLFAEDWHNGASAWSTQRPEAYADDLADATHLAADTARSNRPTSDQDPAPRGCRFRARRTAATSPSGKT
ncbi:hypothetical protein ACIPH4_34385 [Streptomyces tendae]|uniref:hypothetical protein n=1 Tax=Streptomyces tendae TaxID=1932 RepID=UPI0036FFE169